MPSAPNPYPPPSKSPPPRATTPTPAKPAPTATQPAATAIVQVRPSSSALATLQRAADDFGRAVAVVNDGIACLEDWLQKLPAKVAAHVDETIDMEIASICRYSFEKVGGDWRLTYRLGVEGDEGQVHWEADKPLLLAQASADVKTDAAPFLQPLVEAIASGLQRRTTALLKASAALVEVMPASSLPPADEEVNDDDIPF